jgi:hypothetical protein
VAQPLVIAYRPFVAGDTPRPYLVMQVAGINRRSGLVMGMVDSGADTSSFPFAYASLMGYTPATLTQQTIGQVAGSALAYRATQPLRGLRPGDPERGS